MPWTLDELDARKKRLFPIVASLPGFRGIGIGDQHLRVLVLTKEDVVHYPTDFEGIPVEFLVTGEIYAL